MRAALADAAPLPDDDDLCGALEDGTRGALEDAYARRFFPSPAFDRLVVDEAGVVPAAVLNLTTTAKPNPESD